MIMKLKENYYKTQGKLKIQLTMKSNFISSKDSGEIRTMHTKSNKIELMMGNETNEIIEELFKSHLQKYEEGLEKKKMRGSECFLIVLVYCIIFFIKQV